VGPLHHYTLNTGRTVEQSRSSVHDEVIQVLLPMIQAGGGPLPSPFSAYHVTLAGRTGAFAFTLWRGRDPVVLCGLVSDPSGEQQVWDAIEEAYLNLSDKHPALFAPAKAPVKPQCLPWLTCLMMLATTPKIDLEWLGDFERCLAWALLESSQYPSENPSSG